MSLALQTGFGDRIQPQKLVAGRSYFPIYDSPAIFPPGDRIHSPAVKEVVQRREEEDSCSSSSSIGRNSDASSASSDADDDVGEKEVQSSFEGSLHTMNALEEVLPIKRGVSKFYSGKSKSFTSLADVSSSFSIKDLAKPENAYSRKRKNLLAHSIFWDKSHNHALKGNGGLLKRSANSTQSTLAFAVIMSNDGSSCSGENSNSRPSPPLPRLPPLHPQGKMSPNRGLSSQLPIQNSSPCRSYSLSDLQRVATEDMMRAN